MKLELPIDRFLRRLRTKLVLPYIIPNMNICDMGCGINQYLLRSLISIVQGKLVGIDSLILNKISNKMELRSADLEQVPLPVYDNEFDLITMLAVLEHLNTYDNIISECYRGLKIGGQLILTTPSPCSKPLLEFLADKGIISHFGVYDHKKYFRKEELFNLLQKHCFTNIKVWGVACGLNTVAIATKSYINQLI
ncbi:MAG: class I SAM-dependent methyltransferase [Coxiellaceae bacterium]|jgi:ubiquinone/menaquinone biosynthesis C-methylase UbiE|nr:class I SAM-dependent methyltransferase [Coxiellaceae bacterium]